MNPQQNQIMQVQQPAQVPVQPTSMVSALDNVPLVNYVKSYQLWRNDIQ